MPAFNAIAWFEVGTDDPAAAERFYGDVLGWTVANDGQNPTYQIFTTGDPDGCTAGCSRPRGSSRATRSSA